MRIRVDHQLVRTREGQRYIEKTKTECGCCYIPMSNEVAMHIQKVVQRLREKYNEEKLQRKYGKVRLMLFG